MLRVGLIGCGGMGSLHAECWLALGDVAQLVAIADLDATKIKKYADRSGAKMYENGMELLAEAEVDVVDICLPTCLHAEHAVAAMQKGYHVFVEKPVCLHEKEAELLLKTQKETGVMVQVGQVIRFWDEYVWLKKEIENGTYGKVLSGSFFRLSPPPRWAWENWYQDYTKCGTVALDLHVHDADFIRYMMGKEPQQVDARAVRDADGVIQQIVATYDFGDAVITAEGAWNYPKNFPFETQFRVLLEQALIIMEKNGEVTVYLENGDRFRPDIPHTFEFDADIGINVSSMGPYYNELRHFAKLVAGKTDTEIAPLADAVESARLIWKEIDIAGGAKK